MCGRQRVFGIFVFDMDIKWFHELQQHDASIHAGRKIHLTPNQIDFENNNKKICISQLQT